MRASRALPSSVGASFRRAATFASSSFIPTAALTFAKAAGGSRVSVGASFTTERMLP